jgi:hypothetical protein
MTKAEIKDYQILLDSRNKEIELLKFKLENIERIHCAQCMECERKSVQDLSDMHFKFMEISELADKLKDIAKQ